VAFKRAPTRDSTYMRFELDVGEIIEDVAVF
jgi:hypothetical protein